jgi:hypothetical protein
MISESLSPFTVTRNLSSNVFLVVMGLVALLFSILVLMVFRFDLVGGETAAEEDTTKTKNFV